MEEHPMQSQTRFSDELTLQSITMYRPSTMGDTRSPEPFAITERGTRIGPLQWILEAAAFRRPPEPDAWWHAIPAAMAWVMALLIEGYAAYGASMHPGCFEPFDTDAVNRRRPAQARDRTLQDIGISREAEYPAGQRDPHE
jgi:hypothetical protein